MGVRASLKKAILQRLTEEMRPTSPHFLKKVIVSQSNVNQIAYISTLQFGEIVESAV